MSYSVATVNLERLNAIRKEAPALNWNPLFVTPEWLLAWWEVFGAGREPYVREIRDDDEVIGVAPLMVEGKTAYLIGGSDVCDYLDFIVVPGKEYGFFTALLDDLKVSGITGLDLRDVRPDSLVYANLASTARQRGCGVEITPTEVSVEMPLPPSWEEYLARLNSKQRHEVRRKLRRLTEAGEISFRCSRDNKVPAGFMDDFFRMFTESRQDKAEFLTPQREAFFRLITERTAAAGLLRPGVLELDGRVMAAVIGFEYNNGMYLYNSGYDPQYDYLSVGVLSKALCIKECIAAGLEKFDFLKGPEAYKYHLGGEEIALYRCQINMA